MQQNYNIKFNLQEPSSEQIEQHMDFDALLRQFEAEKAAAPAPPPARVRPLRVRRLGYMLGAAATVALLVVAWALLRNDGGMSADEYFAAQPFVQPPLPEVEEELAYAGLQVSAQSGGVVELPNGTRIVVPEQAFMDERGGQIGGEVTIRYRELHDYVDFFVAGVPLRYDSTGQQYHLESAGMIDVYAEQNGRRVFLADDRELQVEFVSYVTLSSAGELPQLHVYRLDTTSRNWSYLSIDQAELLPEDAIAGTDTPVDQLTELTRDYDRRVSELEATIPMPTAPLRPERSSNNQPTLELDFLDDLALAPGSNVEPEALNELNPGGVWQIAPESPVVDERAFNVTWEQVRLRRTDANRYELTLIHPQQQVRLIVRPVLLGDAYNRALADYEREQAAYDRALAGREERLRSERERLQREFDAQRQDLQDELEEQLADDGPERRRVRHRFTVDRFGLYTAARPVQPQLLSVRARYRDEQGREIENLTAYVTNRGQNTVYRYLAADGADLALTPSEDNLLWVVTADGELAVANPEDLRNLQPNDRAIIRVHRTGSRPQSQDAVRKALQFK